MDSGTQIPNYPSNSNKQKKMVLRKVAEASPMSTSKSKQIADIFTSSIEDARRDVWNNQIVPGIMDMCANALYTFVDYIFHPNGGGFSSGRRPFSRDIGARRRDYAGESARRNRAKTGDDGYYDDSGYGRRPRWDEVVVQGGRQDAQRVWDALVERLEDQGQISVGDLFATVGWPTSYNDFSKGWTTLEGCKVQVVNGGWWFNMTKPRNLD